MHSPRGLGDLSRAHSAIRTPQTSKEVTMAKKVLIYYRFTGNIGDFMEGLERWLQHDIRERRLLTVSILKDDDWLAIAEMDAAACPTCGQPLPEWKGHGPPLT